ncbi:MAG: 3-deoxy-8-phosphooctulonate synthase [Proteobacteria bacterium]|nr:3-deoxy-8-phosphooctulonate synthase [Pseudomonadota bacterium]
MSTLQRITVGQDTSSPVTFAADAPLAFLAGPCVIESRAHALEMAHALHEIARRLGVGLVYKSSFDKANRSSVKSFRGPSFKEGMEILAEVRATYSMPVVTDVHTAEQCAPVAEVVDILQIPAFLCRQTDLLEAAAVTGKPLNVKKGQFLAPWDMQNVVNKVTAFGGKLMLCERGASFGYNTLVSDMRALPILARTGCPVIFDATHSVQQPGGAGETTAGQREFVATLAKAAVAVGVAGIFAEVHQDPDHAPSDGPNMLKLKDFEPFVKLLMAYDALAKSPEAIAL